MGELETFTATSALQAEHDEQAAFMWILIITVICLISGLLLSILVVRNINTLLKTMLSNLANSSEQLSSASNQISMSSQQLSEGAIGQASSLEETSSSMEQMASQTKENADNSTAPNLR